MSDQATRKLWCGFGVAGLVVGVWGLGLGILERALRMFVSVWFRAYV